MKTVLVVAFSFFALTACCQIADSLAVTREVDSLLNAANNLRRVGKPQQALPLAQQAADVSKQYWGENNARHAASLHRLASLYQDLRQQNTAEELYLKAIDLRAKVLGREHPDYARSLINLANLYDDKADFAKAELLHLEAKEVLAKALGREHPDYATALNNLATVYKSKADFTKAEPLLVEALAIRAKTLGKEHPEYAQTLVNLGTIYSDKADFDKAEPLYLEALRIQTKVLGRGHPDCANSLNNLGILYATKGEYSKAEPLYLEAISIRAKFLGKGHPDYAQVLNNLANLYRDNGDYNKAELLFLETATIYAKTLGKEHPYYATVVDNIAGLYYNKGNSAKAEPLFVEAIAIRAKTLGKEHPDYATSLFNLAKLYVKMNEDDKAESLFLEAAAIRKKALGVEHLDYANSLNRLALLYMKKGYYSKAEPLYMEVIAIRSKALGKEHPSYAESLFNLAVVYRKKGDNNKAESLYLEALSIVANTLGKDHPDYVSKLNNLAILYNETNRVPESIAIFMEENSLVRRLIDKTAANSSENQMQAYVHTYDNTIAKLRSFAQDYSSPELIRANFDNTLYLKDFLLEKSRLLARSIASSDSLTRDTFDRWQGCNRRLAKEYAKPIAERRFVLELEAEAEGYEKSLTRNLHAFGSARRVLHWQDVRGHLPAGSAAVEFIHYYSSPKRTDSTLYAAMVLRPDWDTPHWITMFELTQLDSLLNHRGERRADYVNNLYTIADRSAKPVGKPQKSLYDLLWNPLEKELTGVKTIYYSPSGLLHRLNLAAIPINLDSVLGDRYNLVELGSTRQLVIPATITPAASDAVLFGGISYDSDSTAMSQANAALDSISIASRGELSFAYTDSTLRVGTWTALPFTDREVTGVEKTLKTAGFHSEIRRGFAATEDVFKTIGAGGKASPRVLHVATHGYFFPDPKTTSARFETSPTFDAAEPVFKLSDHPMIRSGLLLAGANHAWATGKPLREGMEDGILTAYEISQMNLSNTELVVLSACETGLGDIQGNEGVYGLQRAFKIAGAKYLVMSLWQVPDQETSVFMTAFYKHWLEGKMSIPDAFRTTQKEMRERFINPYQWAGFVLVE